MRSTLRNAPGARLPPMIAIRIVDGQPAPVEMPEPDPSTGVVVEVRSAGICGSDLHMIDIGGADFGVTIGHEIAGVTTDGMAVAIEPLLPCGTCELCRNDAYHLCAAGGLRLLGISAPGGMAERLVVPERCLVPLAPGVDPAMASVVEPLAVAVHGAELARINANTSVAVVGAGAIGLCAVAVAVDRGARVDLVARHDHQRSAGHRLGAGEVAGTYDIVVETAGTASAAVTATELVRPGGTIVMLSIHWEPTPGPGLGSWMKEVTVFHSMTYGTGTAGRDIDAAAALLARRPEIAEVLITHRFSLADVAEAFDTARDRSAGAIKVVLACGG